ncbi:Scr1 family TA system antitoxin-like transcriptional regulator [Actinokineospora cianjurensis]|nr:Scr1 family TA system antitoxin-like transcriptional regulator [Actinokineospora cianjurensis]
MQAANHTNTTLAATLGWDRSKLSRLTGGQRRVPLPDLVHLLVTCGHTSKADRDQLLALATHHRVPHHWQNHLNTDLYATTQTDLEHDSIAITYYAPTALPDILHTPEHHHAHLTASPLVPTQTILTRPNPPKITIILGTPALHALAANPDRLRHLAATGRRPHISLRLTTDLSTGPFTLLHTHVCGKVLHLPLHTSSLYTEHPATLRAYDAITTHLLHNTTGPTPILNRLIAVHERIPA